MSFTRPKYEALTSVSCILLTKLERLPSELCKNKFVLSTFRNVTQNYNYNVLVEINFRGNCNVGWGIFHWQAAIYLDLLLGKPHTRSQ